MVRLSYWHRHFALRGKTQDFRGRIFKDLPELEVTVGKPRSGRVLKQLNGWFKIENGVVHLAGYGFYLSVNTIRHDFRGQDAEVLDAALCVFRKDKILAVDINLRDHLPVVEVERRSFGGIH